MKPRKKTLRRSSLFALFFIALAFFQPLNLQAIESLISDQDVTAGSPITISGTINKGEELYVVVTSTDLFKATESQGSKERK